MAPVIHGVGIDLVDVPRFRAMLARYGPRFLARVFTPDERKSCDTTRDPALHYAARFAAKEAVIKAVNAPRRDERLLRDVSVPRRLDLGVEPTFSGRLKKILKAQGIDRIHVSITHTETAAAAVAVAEKNG